MTSQKVRINIGQPPTAAQRQAMANANMAVQSANAQSPYGPIQGSHGATGQPVQEAPNSKEHERFCSFVERFVIERCRDWDQTRMDEEGWKCIQDAKMTYSMIQRVGRGYAQQPK